MDIGLIDVDNHNFPNLAQMKISAYHKAKGDHVERFLGFNEYDKVYKSKIFTFTEDFQQVINAKEIISGGTGYDIHKKLPTDIENIFPDYSLYGIEDTAYGFLSRGCPRGCSFCVVGQKEGLKSCKVADLKSFWNGQKNIEILDPNLLACNDWEDLLDQLISSKATININQGMDIRFMTKEKAAMINKLKIKMLHFAWDNYEFNTYEKLKEFRPQLRFRGRDIRVYVLTNFNTTFEQDLDRVYKLMDLDYDPYIMIYNKELLPKGHEIKRLQRWVNNKFIFYKCKSFNDYK